MSPWDKIHTWLCGLYLAAGLPVFLAGQVTTPPRHVVLQLPFVHQFQFAGIYAAQKQGFFTEAGLEVEVRIPSEQYRAAIVEVNAGRAQFGIAQAHQLIVNRIEGMDVVVMAAIMQHSPQVLVTRAQDNLNTPHDLIGKRVALDGTSLGSEIKLMLEQEGVGFDRVTIVPNNWAVNELADDVADAMSVFVIDAPFTLNRSGIPVRVIRPLDYGVDFYGDCLFTNERTLNTSPEVVAAMRTAVLRGWEYALRNPDEMIEWILANHPTQSAVVTRQPLDLPGLKYEAGQVARLINAELIELGRINPGRWQQMAEGLKKTMGMGDLTKINQMLYQPPQSWREWLQARSPWLLGGFAVVAGLFLLALLVNRRLQMLVRRRTAELEISEQRQRDYFELAPAPIVIEDYTDIEPMLGKIREAGVKDLRQHLAEQPDLVKELLKNKRIVAANRLALARSGFATVEDFDHGLAEIMTPETYDSFVDEMVAIWDGVDRLTMERSYRRKDGGEIYAILNWEVTRKEGIRDLARVHLIFTEITEQKNNERALRESEARYRQIFEQAPIAVVEFDYTNLESWFVELRARGVTSLETYLQEHPEAKTKVLQLAPLTNVNAAAVKMIGAESKQHMLQHLGEIFTENTINTRCANVVRVWNGATESVGEFEVRRLDGQIRTLSFQWQMQQENGVPLFSRTQVLLTDITDRMAAERALRASEVRYRELFEQAASGIYRSAPNGKLLSVNPALARMVGFAGPKEMIQWSEKNNALSLYVKPGRRDEFVAALEENDQISGFESELWMQNGGTVWVSESVRIVRDESGSLVYYEGFVTDISLRRQLEAEMGRASKLEAVGILAGGIAHDFNNILTVVLGNVTLAEADTNPGSPVGTRLQDARKATMRARDLTMQLLTFAKGGEPIRSLIDLRDALKESAAFALHGAKARGEYDFAANLWPVSADKGQVGQVIQNLVINAVQAMPDGGVVTLSARNVELPLPGNETIPLGPGRYVQVTVADTGVGIAPEQLTKVFDPYYTTKAQGSGLGLATTYSVVRKHEGHIVVQSEVGAGTAFRFWLPAARDATTPTAKAPGGSRSPFLARVLFMDDEPAIRAMAAVFMKRIGYDCEVSSDGAEAVQKYQQAMADGNKFGVVIMDLTVPGGMGGLQAMEQLRRIDPEVCAIVSSGYSRDPVLSNYQTHGFQAILPKPYGLEQLTKVMRTVLEEPVNPT